MDRHDFERQQIARAERRLPKVLLTPHCAGGSVEAVVAMANRCVDNILAIRDRSPLGEDLLNPEALAG